MRRDIRKISKKNREKKRAKALECLKAGMSVSKVAEETGYHRSSIYLLKMKLFTSGTDTSGLETIVVGRPSKLSNPNEERILRIISSRPFEDKNYHEHRLWSRSRVDDLLTKEFSIVTTKTHSLRLLKKIGLTFKKLNKRVPPAWLSYDYPQIVDAAKKEKKKVKIYFFDTTHTSMTLLSKYGKVDESKLCTLKSVSVVYGAVPPSKGQTYFWVTPVQHLQDHSSNTGLSSTHLIRFIEVLMDEPENRKAMIYLILEKYGLCSHIQFINFVKSLRRLKVFYIPSKS